MSAATPKAFAVPFSALRLWSVRSFFDVRWDWPEATIRPLGDALDRRHEATPEDAAGLRLLTIQFDGSISERTRGTAEAFKGRLFRAAPGDVVYSKIDVRNGAIGLVPEMLTGAAVSAEYPVYSVRRDVAEPGYVTLLARSQAFRRIVNGMVAGASGRKRVTPDAFESIRVPFPALAVQRAIVAHAARAEAAVAALTAGAADTEAGVTEAVGNRLGLYPVVKPRLPRAFALPWDGLGRWATEYVRQSRTTTYTGAEPYPLVRLGDVVADLENGWSPKCHPFPAAPEAWGVLKVGAVSFGAYNDHQNKELPATLAPVLGYEVQPGDVLIGRANVLRLVGACAQVTETRARLMLCDKIFRVVFHEASAIEPAYLPEVMKLPHVRHQIEMEATGTSPTMKNIGKPSLLDLRFPLPPRDVQREIVDHAATVRAEASRHRAEASRRRAAARAEVEAMILGTAPPPGA